MSYILDALRRAERERHAGKAPGMESLTQAAASAAARVPAAIWVLAMLTLLLAAAALVLALRQRPAPAAAPAIASLPAPAPLAAPVREASAGDAQAAAAHEAAAAAIAGGETLSSLDDVVDDAADVGSEANDAPPAAAVITPRPERKAAADAPRPAPNAAAESSTAQAPAAEAPSATSETAPPRLADMPESYRAQFPQFSLDVHVHNADAARSWIMVSGQRYKEGDSLPNGAHIVHIVDNGVVYDYDGQQVLVPNR